MAFPIGPAHGDTHENNITQWICVVQADGKVRWDVKRGTLFGDPGYLLIGGDNILLLENETDSGLLLEY